MSSKRNNGEGSIYKRKDGRWCAAYYDQNYKRKYVYGGSRTEVKNKLADLQRKREDQQANADNDYTLESWIDEYLRMYKKNSLKPTTYGDYLTILDKHITGSWLGQTKLDEVDLDMLQRYYNEKTEAGYSAKTISHIKSLINGSFQVAVRRKLVNDNPNQYAVIPPKKRYEGKTLTKEEVKRIIDGDRSDELYPIVLTTVLTGMRKGEVLGLTWDCVDFENRKIYVRKALCRVEADYKSEDGHRHFHYELLPPKSKKSIRSIPMLDEVYRILMEQKDTQNQDKEKYRDFYVDHNLVFADKNGEFFPQRTFMRHYHLFLKRMGVSDIRFHDLRHTFASLLIDADVSLKVVQEILGHSTISTSMDIYSHVSEEKKESAIKSLGL
ncbi:Site-specific recombinase XerD [Lachnospiraceae bacterium XBB2008]|nr:Site-specific recombinase XerD [Lachnospiraceae bacterium XBB2008]